MPKSGMRIHSETGAFLKKREKSIWQNSQFYRNVVDKIGEMDYIVKSKTNGD